MKSSFFFFALLGSGSGEELFLLSSSFVFLPFSSCSSSESELSESLLRRAVDAFLSLALTNFLLLLLPALLLLALLFPLAFPPEVLDEELDRDPGPDLEEDRDLDFDLDLELDLLDPGVVLRDLDLEELRDFDLDLSESESELDCLFKILIMELF